MSQQQPLKIILDLIDNSSSSFENDDFVHSDVYLDAVERRFLPKLHSIFLSLAPQGSKISPQYHHRNLQAALKECDQDDSLAAGVVSRYLSYLFDHGNKFLLIDQMTIARLAEYRALVDGSIGGSFVVERTMILDDDSPEARESPIHVVIVGKAASGATTFLLHEAVESFDYVPPDDSLLSKAGLQFQSQMRLKKKMVVSGFHKVILSPDMLLRVTLVDPYLLKPSETPADKATAIHRAIDSLIKRPGDLDGTFRRVTFFSAIQPLYQDPTVGEVWGGYFYTSAGSRFLNSSKGSGSDLRADPFQRGGDKAAPDSPFVKLQIAWPHEDGCPKVWLSGSGEMLDNPQQSLPWVQVEFSTKDGGSSQFLEKVLTNATW